MGNDQQLAAGITGTDTFASPIGLDRIVRKEVSLGAIREMPVPETHIGLQMLAPFMEVDSDDVIFDYIKDAVSGGMSPARAEDAEAELARKDDIWYGQGRASIIDWSEKNAYRASDVQRYRENMIIAQQVQGVSGLSLNAPQSAVEAFNAKVAKDDASRSRRLYNRIEWLIQQAVWTNNITYNDGKIKFSVDYGRPVGQSNMAPASGLYDVGTAHDPINDLLALQQQFFDTYGVKFDRAICSQKILNTFWKSAKFIPLTGMGGNPAETRVDPNYLMAGWGPDAAQAIIERVTGIKFTVYDSVYRTRAWGSQTVTRTRFSPQDKILFLPSMADLAEIDDTDIGFAKTLTSPHPEGNFTAGFYEWEKSEVDPWMHIRGSGVKAFPVFPYLQYTATMKVLT